MSGPDIPSLPLSNYRTYPENHYGESLAFPVDAAYWHTSSYGGYPYQYGYGGYPYASDWSNYYNTIVQQLKDQHDAAIRNHNKAELAKISELRNKIEKYT